MCVHASHKQQISSHDGGTTTASGLHTGQLSGTRCGDSIGLRRVHTGQLSGTRYSDSVRLHTGQLSEARYSGGLRTGQLSETRYGNSAPRKNSLGPTIKRRGESE